MAKLAKVSGPLIVAEDMKGGQINEVVMVGEEELMGEIISVKNDRASIQVYEDTSGLKPGDKIVGTGAPLQVELGPGLLTNVYDGIQRPLESVRDQSGAFITRGVKANALDRKKKWDFKPVLKKGAEAKPGDVIGLVQETNITHKVMLPPSFKPGKITSISDGKFTVTQPVAEVSGGQEATLMHPWSVRLPRPFADKLPFGPPLVTGKRIIDTFFPIAKGGAGAIPGPFGSGKCVSGTTPIMLPGKGIVTMQDLYHEFKKSGEAKTTFFEETITSNEKMPVYSFTENKVRETNTSFFYKGKSDSLLRVKTRSGRFAEVTPVHKLFKITPELEIVETPAKEIKAGDFIVSIRKITPAGRTTLPASLKGVKVKDERVKDDLSTALKNRGGKTLRQIALEANVPFAYLKRFHYSEALPRLEDVTKLYAYFKLPLPSDVLLAGNRESKAMRVPEKMTPELAEFLGLYLSEGYLRGPCTVVFTNSDEALLKRFQNLCKQLFGLETSIERQNGKTPNVLASSAVLTAFLKSINSSGKAKTKTVPAAILSSDATSIAAFIESYFIGDGSYYDGQVEITTASTKMALGISYGLTLLGVMHSNTEKPAGNTTYHRIFIRGRDNLKNLSNTFTSIHAKVDSIRKYVQETKTAWSSTDVVPLSKTLVREIYEKAGEPYTALKKNGVEISNYLSGEKMSVATFKKFVEAITTNENNGQLQIQSSALQCFAASLEWIYCDQVERIEELQGPHDVFDVSIPGIENWVGGNGALLLHNTVNQQDLAKYADADVIVYIGCGERGNEMTEVLTQFPELQDPRTGKPLMQRTVLIANTSNMPVAAREASVYTGITLAEYYRDMGYDVALMADSTSRWAEAMREISGRMEEMPGEEGYPAYLSRKLAEFYERSGRVRCLGSDAKRLGSVTVVGAVSPPGGDISEPVSQGTLRITKVFWALDANLSRRRHYPAINWLKSYSLYGRELEEWFEKEVAPDFYPLKAKAMALLQKEAELQNIVQLIGPDALPDKERLVLEATKMIREDFLQQNSYDEVDAYSTPKKQYLMLKAIMNFYEKADASLALDVSLEKIVSSKKKDEISKLKRVKEADFEKTATMLIKSIEAGF